MKIDQIPGVQISSYPADSATLAPLLSLGMDEDQARVHAAYFSQATNRAGASGLTQ